MFLCEVWAYGLDDPALVPLVGNQNCPNKSQGKLIQLTLLTIPPLQESVRIQDELTCVDAASFRGSLV
jgi:hypothetical protein